MESLERAEGEGRCFLDYHASFCFHEYTYAVSPSGATSRHFPKWSERPPIAKKLFAFFARSFFPKQADRGFAAQCFRWLILSKWNPACGKFLLNIVGSGSHVTQFFSIRDPSQAVYSDMYVCFRMPVSYHCVLQERGETGLPVSSCSTLASKKGSGVVRPGCRFHYVNASFMLWLVKPEQVSRTVRMLYADVQMRILIDGIL